MNDQRTYESIINRAKRRDTVDGYYEWHHIVPRSMGGSDDASNRVRLTYKEHRLCHYLLYRIFRKTNPKLVFAIELFYTDLNPNRIAQRHSVRLPKWLRRERQLVASRCIREMGFIRVQEARKKRLDK